jgi:hypothetical protein
MPRSAWAPERCGSSACSDGRTFGKQQAENRCLRAFVDVTKLRRRKILGSSPLLHTRFLEGRVARKQDQYEQPRKNVGAALHHKHRHDAHHVTKRAPDQRAREHEQGLGCPERPEDAAPVVILCRRLQEGSQPGQHPGGGDSKMERAMSTLAQTIVFLRSQRSTNTPATDPNSTVGRSPAVNIAPVASAEPVRW